MVQKQTAKESKSKPKDTAANGDFNSGVPNLTVYAFSAIEVATDGFLNENKLGEGGYGPVYKVMQGYSNWQDKVIVLYWSCKSNENGILFFPGRAARWSRNSSEETFKNV